MYFFYRLFEWNNNDKEVIFDDVIIADDRNKAKETIINLHGDYPFRKLKNIINGSRYYYLTDSDEYWYKYHHEEFNITCVNCEKNVVVVGNKNMFNHKNKFGEYCSIECKHEYTEVKLEEERANNPFINEHDHFGVPKDDDINLVGYIYRITNKNTMKSYIGKTIKPPLFRWWQHLKIEKKFEQCNVSELVFEVMEIVTWNKNCGDEEMYESRSDKLSRREMFYITHNNVVEEGYNKMIETTKTPYCDYQLSLSLEQIEN